MAERNREYWSEDYRRGQGPRDWEEGRQRYGEWRAGRRDLEGRGYYEGPGYEGRYEEDRYAGRADYGRGFRGYEGVGQERDYGRFGMGREGGGLRSIGYGMAREGERRVGRGPKSYQRSDDRIREEVCERLMRGWMNAEDVDVQVRSGEVTLLGMVDSRQEKRAIEDLAEDVLGVKEVHNQLRVRRVGVGTEATRSTQGRGDIGRAGAQPDTTNMHS